MKSKMLRTKSKGEKHLNESSVTIVNACRVSFFYMSSSSVMFLFYNIQKRKKKASCNFGTDFGDGGGHAYNNETIPYRPYPNSLFRYTPGLPQSCWSVLEITVTLLTQR